MASYVLVHGAWHGGWCWYRVVARLQRASQRVIAPDLLSLGRDDTPPGSITLATWTEQVAELVESMDEPVVLVGHSRGGIVLSEVAEKVPGRIRLLVYVTAFLLENGRTLQECATSIADSLVPAAMIPTRDRLSATVRESAVRDAFYGRCNDDDVALARSLLKPEPLQPLATPVRVTEARFGSVPRVYIECTDDRAITHSAQRGMQALLPCRQRVTLDSDHSPFFCRPDELTAALLRL